MLINLTAPTDTHTLCDLLLENLIMVASETHSILEISIFIISQAGLIL